MSTVGRSAWYAHSETILQSMLCSKNEEERKEAVNRILNIRGIGDEGIQVGDSSLRVRRTPEINPNAKQLSDLCYNQRVCKISYGSCSLDFSYTVSGKICKIGN